MVSTLNKKELSNTNNPFYKKHWELPEIENQEDLKDEVLKMDKDELQFQLYWMTLAYKTSKEYMKMMDEMSCAITNLKQVLDKYG